MNKKNIIVNWHYFKLMTMTNYVNNGHQMVMYRHDFPINIKKENQWPMKYVSFNWH